MSFTGRTLPALLVCVSVTAGIAAWGEINAVGRYEYTKPNRVDKNTQGELELMPNALFTSCVEWVTFSRRVADFSTNYVYATDSGNLAVNGLVQTVAASTAAFSNEYGGFCQFDGINDYYFLRNGNETNLNFGTAPFSIGVWTRLKSVGANHPIVYGNLSTDWLNIIDLHASAAWRFSVKMGGTGYNVLSLADPQANQWYHLLGTREGTNLVFYVDGVYQNQSLCTAQAVDFNAGTKLLGAYVIGSAYAPAAIGEFYAFNRALTTNEVMELYTLSKGTYGY